RLVEDRHPGLLRLRELRAGALAGDQASGLLRDGITDLGPQALERGLRLFAGVVREGARDHIALAGERALDRTVLLAGLHPQAELAQLLDEPAVHLVLEPLGDRGSAIRADPVDPLQLLDRRAEQAVDRPQFSGENAGSDAADIGDVEAIEDAPDRDRLRTLDRGDHVRGAALLQPVASDQ